MKKNGLNQKNVFASHFFDQTWKKTDSKRIFVLAEDETALML